MEYTWKGMRSIVHDGVVYYDAGDLVVSLNDLARQVGNCQYEIKGTISGEVLTRIAAFIHEQATRMRHAETDDTPAKEAIERNGKP